MNTRFKFVVANVAQTKTEMCNLFDFFWIMTIKNNICIWWNKLQQFCFEDSKTIKVTNMTIKFTPFFDHWWQGKVSEIVVTHSFQWNFLRVSCSA